ncbi:hypothetical protein [Dyadobacter sp. LHD-138]|uniref:hypothetical protein n=1 Tax=Dyadobacter sp. LHD-138 TaxID=3071413 RepID=UPI0027E0941E|nr:hypothetical protein [Dyadobacter sp. LHD-138]MDQ6480000.1 hypothetical protein [Dyadobacter sp. LHD-138]
MKTFATVNEAFKWWMDNVYKQLPADQKKGRLKTAWMDYTYEKGISEKRMKAILAEFGTLEVRTIVTFTPE